MPQNINFVGFTFLYTLCLFDIFDIYSEEIEQYKAFRIASEFQDVMQQNWKVSDPLDVCKKSTWFPVKNKILKTLTSDFISEEHKIGLTLWLIVTFHI